LCEQASGLKFNLSNSMGLVVCAVAHGLEIGVDVEPYTRAKTIEKWRRGSFRRGSWSSLSRCAGKSGGSAG